MTLASRPFPLITLAIVLMLCGVSAAAATIEHKGWLYGQEADAAIEKAKKHGVPIAIMRAHRETTCPKCVNAAGRIASAKSTRKMVRVMSYIASDAAFKSGQADSLVGQASKQNNKHASGFFPELYLVMPDGKALGFVPYEQTAAAEDEVKTSLQIAQWLNSAQATIDKADKDAGRGRYAAALKAINKIVEQDAEISHLISIQLGRAKKGDKAPAQPANPAFPGLRDEKLKAYQDSAMAKVQEARRLAGEDKLRDAQRLLLPLTRGPVEFESTEAAKALLQEVLEQMRAS